MLRAAQSPARSAATAPAGRAIAQRVDELADQSVAAITARIPAYGAASAETLRDVRRHIVVHFRTFAGLLEAGATPTREDFDFVRDFAARRVRQVTVGDFVGAFVVAQGLLWRALREVPRQSRATQLDLADALLSYFEIAITQATEVYLENANLSGAADERGRRDVLSDLLAGRPVLHGRLAATAGAHGLDGDGPFLVVSGGVPDGEDEPGPLRAAARTLADAVAGNHPPLAVGRHDEIVVIANVESRSRPFGPSLERARRTLASHGLHVAIGASAVVDSLVDLPAAYDEALTARARAAESTGVLVVADLTLFGFLTLQRDATAQRLVDDRVRTFVAEDTAAGGSLLETLVAFVTCDLNVRRVADQLHVHVNTAHYRLDRIASRTGRDLRHIPDLFELLTAVRLLRPDLGRQG